MKEIRVRYAPSPTGNLHIGNARTAIFNYLFAKHNNGKLIFRIEDTDIKRNIINSDINQLKSLEWLGVQFDESPIKPGKVGPYYQSKRLHIYNYMINILIKKKFAYKCYCTNNKNNICKNCIKLSLNEQKKKERNGYKYVVKFKVFDNINCDFLDMIKGKICFNSNNIGGDFIIKKTNGMPTYNFAVVIDDYFMKISHVLRGDDHIANTPKQILIYKAFNWGIPIFGHMSLIIDLNSKKKLSKRESSIFQFIEQYKKLGYISYALFNFISLLGWSPKDNNEILSKDIIIKKFNIFNVNKSPAIFDIKKLNWINNKYIKQIPINILSNYYIQYLLDYKFIKKEDFLKKNFLYKIEKIINLYKNKLKFLYEILEFTKFFFKEPIFDKKNLKEIKINNKNLNIIIKEIIIVFKKIDLLNLKLIKEKLNNIKLKYKLKNKEILMPLRIILTGFINGPDLISIISLIEKRKLLKRLYIFIKKNLKKEGY